MELSFIPSLAVVLCIVFLGVFCRRWLGILRELALPAAIVGGLVYLLLQALWRHFAELELGLSADIRRPFMLAFFASVGLGASLQQLRKGGRGTLLFLIAAVGLLVAQNVVGVLGARAFEMPPFLGLIFGSITLSGGHGTGLAWANTFERLYGMDNLESLALASATIGVVAGGLVGGPVAARLIKRHRLTPPPTESWLPKSQIPAHEQSFSANSLLGHLLLLLFCIVLAERMPNRIAGVTVPSFLWAIIGGIALRAALDKYRRFRPPAVETLGEGALSIFIATAMATLSWGEIAAMWLPLLVIVTAQVLTAAVFASTITFRVMGGDYTAAVCAAGHCGFGLGSTPNAVNNMLAVGGRYGTAPKALLIVPLVGAFFIDIANALVLEGFINLL